nr:hypothetical protein [Tanacetum cinerariifolium]
LQRVGEGRLQKRVALIGKILALVAQKRIERAVSGPLDAPRIREINLVVIRGFVLHIHRREELEVVVAIARQRAYRFDKPPPARAGIRSRCGPPLGCTWPQTLAWLWAAAGPSRWRCRHRAGCAAAGPPPRAGYRRRLALGWQNPAAGLTGSGRSWHRKLWFCPASRGGRCSRRRASSCRHYWPGGWWFG